MKSVRARCASLVRKWYNQRDPVTIQASSAFSLCGAEVKLWGCASNKGYCHCVKHRRRAHVYVEDISFPMYSEASLCCLDHRDGLQNVPAFHLLLAGHLVLQT